MLLTIALLMIGLRTMGAPYDSVAKNSARDAGRCRLWSHRRWTSPQMTPLTMGPLTMGIVNNKAADWGVVDDRTTDYGRHRR